jgi:hypothetical protein
MGGWDQKISREIGWGSVESIQLAPDRDQWQALVNTVIATELISLVNLYSQPMLQC